MFHVKQIAIKSKYNINKKLIKPKDYEQQNAH